MSAPECTWPECDCLLLKHPDRSLVCWRRRKGDGSPPVSGQPKVDVREFVAGLPAPDGDDADDPDSSQSIARQIERLHRQAPEHDRAEAEFFAELKNRAFDGDDAATLRRIADDELGGENNATVYAIASRISTLVAERDHWKARWKNTGEELSRVLTERDEMQDEARAAVQAVQAAADVNLNANLSLARREERERCAKIADARADQYLQKGLLGALAMEAESIAAAIRKEG